MRVQPIFTGKVHVATVKNEQCDYQDYETSKKDDARILRFTDEVFSYGYPIHREPVEQHDGERLRALIERTIGAKIDLPKDCVYTYKRSSAYNPDTDKVTHHILLVGEEGSNSIGAGDRTAVDVWI